MIYRPVRERDPKDVIDTVLRALEKSGQDEVSLTALSTADVSAISPLIKRIVEKTAPERVSLGVASLRAYGLAEDLLDDLGKVRASGLTFAPEAGTQRMRNVINKNVTEEQLMETAERAFSRRFDKMKLYFIVGLPTEEYEDVLGIINVGKNALGVGKRLGRNPKVTVSVSTHVPKPHTPFQWCAMDTLPEIERKQQLLRDTVRSVRGLGLKLHDAPTSVLECILARGDRRLANVIERAFLGGARCSDSWDDHLRLDLWQEALEHSGIDTNVFLGTIRVDARVPWDHLDIGLEEGFLAREYRKALAGRASPPCGKVAGAFIHATNAEDAEAEKRRLVCYDCGIACDLGKMREERLVYLRKLGAHERPAPPAPPAPVLVADESSPPVEAAPPPARVKPRNARPETRRPLRPGGVPKRFRLRFEKVGPAALLGHLDLARELPRAIRRAGVRIRYSEGFHPKPDLSFGPALSLGVASLDEYVDVKLIDAPSGVELVERLVQATSGGLRFLAAVPLEQGDPAVSAVVTGARYVIALARGALDAHGGVEALEERIRALLDKSEAVLRRDIGGVGKLVDVRKYVHALARGGDDAFSRLAAAGIVGSVVPLEVEIGITPNGSAKVSEVVEALFGESLPHLSVRAMLLAGAGTPLDLALHRRAPPPVTVSASA